VSLQRIARFALAALAILALSVLVRNEHFPLTFRAGLVAFAVLSAMRPADALLAAAVAGPFSGLLAEMLGSPPFRGYESVMLAFLAGWLLHAPPVHRGAASRRVLLPATLMMALIVASVIMLGLQLHAADAAFFWKTAAGLRDAYLWTADVTGVVEGANIIIGILVLVAVVELTEHDSGLVFSLIKMMAVAAAFATALSLLLAAGIGTPSTLARQAATLSRWLVRAGIAPGDRVAIFSPNRGEMLVAEFAVMGMGATYVPIFAGYAAEQATALVKETASRLASLYKASTIVSPPPEA